MKILVTGCSGFLGSNLCRHLLKMEHEVLGIDILDPKIEKHESSFTFINSSFLDLTFVNQLPERVDVAIHLARTIKPGPKNQDFVKDINENVLGTLSLYDALDKNKLKKFIYVSSGGTVYGDQVCPKEGYQEDQLCKPISIYGQSCLTTENYLKLLSRKRDCTISILRLANPFGLLHQQGRAQGLINVVIEKAIKNETLEVWGDGENVRDYIHMDDVLSAIGSIMNYSGNKQTFNVGSGIGKSVKEIIKDIEQITGLNIKVDFQESRGVDVKKNLLDIKKGKTELNWQPKKDFPQAITEIFEFYKSHLEK